MAMARRIGWRTGLAIAATGCCVALTPVGVLAQQPVSPSGAAVQVGGVSSSGSAGGRTAPVVLPNTGGGPATDDNNPAIPVVAGLVVLGTLAYLRNRLTRRQVRG